MLDVRLLVALDMALHGRRFILFEFGAGVLFPGFLGLLSAARGQWLVAAPLLWIALNYVPLLIHAVDFARSTERPSVDLSLARSYSGRQLWILVPFAVVLFDLNQRLTRSA